MTVLHLLPTFDSGGLGSLALQMIRAWPEDARHIVVAPRYKDTKPVLFGAFQELAGKGNVAQVPRNLMTWPTVYVQELTEQLRKMQRGDVPKTVINYNFSDAVWNVQAVRRAKFEGRVLCHVGTVLPTNHAGVKKAATSKFHWNTLFVPASSTAREALMQIRGEWTFSASGHFGATPPVPGCVNEAIWNGVDHTRFLPRQPGYRPMPLRIGFTGRMTIPEVKDWSLLLNSFRSFVQQGGQGVLRIAGTGPMLPMLKKMGEGYPVEFVGLLPPDEIPRFLSELDVFFMAALPIEGFSMALVEAIVARCMIVGSFVPSVTELCAEPFCTPVPVHDDAGEVHPLPLVETAEQGATALLELHRPDVQLSNQRTVEYLAAQLEAHTMAAKYAALSDPVLCPRPGLG